MSANSRPLIAGTRGSALALTQTRTVGQLLQAAHPGLVIEERIVKTTGDRRLDLSLASTTPLDKGLFTRELEEELAEGRIDFAVHSLKDLPTAMDERFALAAILPREDPADLLIYHRKETEVALVEGRPETLGHLATSSPRRARQMRVLYPAITLHEIRGNVPTRLRKLRDSSHLDAMVLALAGLKRLGLCDAEGRWTEAAGEFAHLGTALLPTLLPAPGQGAVAVQIRSADAPTAALFAPLHCQRTAACVQAERALLGELGGGCHLALGVRAQWIEASPEATLHLEAVFFPSPAPNAPAWRGEATGPAAKPADVAHALRARWPEGNDGSNGNNGATPLNSDFLGK